MKPALFSANSVDACPNCNGAGRIVFEGTPADVVAAGSTVTGEHLAADVGS